MKTRLASFIFGIVALWLAGSVKAEAPDGSWGMAKRNGAAWDMKFVAPGASKFFGTDLSGNLVLSTVPAALTDGDKGSITVSGTGTIWTINNGAVSNAMLANSGITINGVSVALGGSVSNLQTSNGTLALGGFSGITGTLAIGNLPANVQTTDGALALGGFSGITGTLAVANGGTGQASYTNGQLLIGNTATGLLSKSTLTAGSNVTITNGNGTITIAASGGGGGAATMLLVNNTQTQNSSTAETDLVSYTIPANTLASDGQSIEFEVSGTFAANANGREMKVYFGVELIGTANQGTNNGSWWVRGRIVRRGASSQWVTTTIMASELSAVSATMCKATSTGTSRDETGTIVFRVTGTGGATADIIKQCAVVTKWAAP